MVLERDHPDGATPGAESTADATEPFSNRVDWRAGGFAGLVASVAMGVAITATDVTVIGEAIAGLYGFEGSLVSGWVAHLVHGTAFGVVFAVVLSDPAFHRLTDWLWKTVLGAVVYGVVLGVGYYGLADGD